MMIQILMTTVMLRKFMLISKDFIGTGEVRHIIGRLCIVEKRL
jgi:hypothetical protein